MTKMLLGLVASLVMLVGIVPASAQTPDPTALMAMLAVVPDTPEARGALVSYADYRALEAVRGIDGVSAADFVARTDQFALWIAASQGLSSGLPLNYVLSGLAEMPDLVGFSFFDVNQSLVYGNPPGQGIVLAGDFDPDRIAAAYTARGYQSHDFDGVTVWCGPDGCDSGLEMNLADRNPANPFGGQFGRHEPLAVLPAMLADSPDLNVLQGVLAASHGSQPALADAPDYRTLAGAAAAQGQVVQIQFANLADLMTVDVASMPLDTDGQSHLKAAVQNYGTLPVYTLAAFADVWDGSDQWALILLAYGDGDTAQAAADELHSRLENFVSLSTGQPAGTLFESFGAAPQEPAVYTDPETSTAAAVWALRYPVPSNTPGDNGKLAISSAGFRWLVNAFYRRELYALATSLPPTP